MMRRRFRRRAGPKWTYANSQELLVDSSHGTTIGSSTMVADFTWLLPPARAQFLMNTRNRDRMQFSGAHIWLDFAWRETGDSNPHALPDVNFAIMKSEVIGDTGLPDLSPLLGQWTEPSTPASITSWEEDDDDGTNPFLWQHYIRGISPLNMFTQTLSGGHTFNQTTFIQADGEEAVWMCRKNYVTQEWQPDVVVRSRRTIRKGEGIVLCMSLPLVVTQPSAVTQVRFRTLTK